MLPHSAWGSVTPIPRKLSPAMPIIMVPIWVEAFTTNGPSILGSRVLNRMAASLQPESRAALT